MSDFFDDYEDDDYIEQEMEFINESFSKEVKKLKKRKYKDGMTLEEVLEFMTKTELVDIAYYHEVKGVKRRKKAEMIPYIANMILADLDDFIMVFNESHLEALEALENHQTDTMLLNMEAAASLSEAHCIFPYLHEDAISFFVPSDISEKIKHLAKENSDIIELNTFVIKAIEMAVEYYGVISMEDLANVFSKDIFDGVPEPDIQELLSLNIESASLVEFDGELVYDSHLSEIETPGFYEYLHNEIQTNFTKDYRIITGGDLIEYLEGKGVNKHSKDLLSFLSSDYGLEDDEAEELSYMISKMASTECEPENLIEHLSANYPDRDDALTESLRKIITGFYSEHPVWMNKGYSADEIDFIANRLDERGKVIPFARKEEKVSRNSPCPCGSGKKYKKCCLKK